jgi:hypothetical protein
MSCSKTIHSCVQSSRTILCYVSHARDRVNDTELDFHDSWSEDEVPKEAKPTDRIQRLEAELQQAKRNVSSLQTLLKDTMIDETPIAGPSMRDDDTHYFDSYAENGECRFGCRSYRHPRDHAKGHNKNGIIRTLSPIQSRNIQRGNCHGRRMWHGHPFEYIAALSS